MLTLTKVLDLRLDAEMVVLSACVTGRGEATEGEGVVNFARAFHQAGARSVVVSLWEVASEAAEDFMKRFYGHLNAGKPKAEALSLARKEMKALYPNPFFGPRLILNTARGEAAAAWVPPPCACPAAVLCSPQLLITMPLRECACVWACATEKSLQEEGARTP